MRLGTGLAVLGVCVVALGWWGTVEYARHIQDRLQAAAQARVATSVHGASVVVSGRDIRVSGQADGPVEHDRLMAALDRVPGRRVVVDDLQVLPVVRPFALTAVWLDGALQVEGQAPDAAAQARFAALGADGLPLAAGAPDRAWGAAAALGIEAMQQLDSGTLALVDRRMSLAGVARTPVEGAAAEAVLARLPDGYQADVGLSYLDDGTPAAYRLRYTVTDGARLDGKLPRGVTAQAVADALGLPGLRDNASRALTGAAGTVAPVLAALRPWLDDVETLTVSVGPEGTAVEAGFGKGADLELLGNALAAAVGGDASVTVSEVAARGADGDRRSNPATGQQEVLQAGYWLPAIDFTPDATTCPAQADAILARDPIGFVSGSSRLDAHARRAINALAAVLGPCLRDAGLRVEINGHTDATGSDQANQALSLARAQAVRAALVARGVPDGLLSAAGHGATAPVADNSSEAGRAANRRIELRWIS